MDEKGKPVTCKIPPITHRHEHRQSVAKPHVDNSPQKQHYGYYDEDERARRPTVPAIFIKTPYELRQAEVND